MNPKGLPEDILIPLESHGVSAGDVVQFLRTDLSSEGRYAGEWVVLTRESLILLGTGISSYRVSDLEELKAESLISSGMLTAKMGGKERVLCRFSNGLSKDFGQLARIVKKLKEGESLEKGDLHREEGTQECPKCGLRYPDPHRKVCPKCLKRSSLFLRILSYVPRYIGPIVFILLFIMASSALKLAGPFLGGRVFFDEVLAEGGRYHGRILEMILVMVAAQIVAMLFDVAYGRINAVVTARVFFDLKSDIFTAMQRLSLSFFNRKQTGGLMTRVNYDALQLQYFFIDGVPYLTANFFSFLGIAVIMAMMNWQLTLMVFLPGPVVVYISRKLWPRIWQLYSRKYRRRSVLNSVINDTLTGMRVVKAFGKEAQEIRRFSPVNVGLYSANQDYARLTATVYPLFHIIMQIGGLIVWALGGWRVVNGALSFGTLMSFIGYLAMIYNPMRYLTQIVDWWSSCMNSAHRIFEIIDSQPEVVESPQPIRSPRISGNVALRGVTFAYEPNKPVLHDIDLEVKAGDMIGLVGHTGAGKSTLTNLITRLYDVEEGEILIDGNPVKELSLADLRSQIGIVLQDTYLFNGTIAENIAYGSRDADLPAVIAAAKKANAHDFITKMQNGYDTLLGKKGVDLSGGERQRISIARTLLLDPRILIFDEATASVDTETEQKIQKAIEVLVAERTTVAIAHRLSTLRRADRLIVLEKGRIKEQGSHDDLMKSRGIYYRLVARERKALKMIGVGD
jgi:ATP-binding cassette subfamily B protein